MEISKTKIEKTTPILEYILNCNDFLLAHKELTEKLKSGQITKKEYKILSPFLRGKKLLYGSNPYISALSSCQNIVQKEKLERELDRSIREKKFGSKLALDCDTTVTLFKTWTKKMIQENYFLLEGCGNRLYDALIRDRDAELIEANPVFKKYYNSKRKLIDYSLIDPNDNIKLDRKTFDILNRYLEKGIDIPSILYEFMDAADEEDLNWMLEIAVDQDIKLKQYDFDQNDNYPVYRNRYIIKFIQDPSEKVIKRVIEGFDILDNHYIPTYIIKEFLSKPKYFIRNHITEYFNILLRYFQNYSEELESVEDIKRNREFLRELITKYKLYTTKDKNIRYKRMLDFIQTLGEYYFSPSDKKREKINQLIYPDIYNDSDHPINQGLREEFVNVINDILEKERKIQGKEEV
jgi:hypothetical protein